MKFRKIPGSPRYYAEKALKLLMWRASALLGDATIVLKAQMDTDPESLRHDPSFIERTEGAICRQAIDRSGPCTCWTLGTLPVGRCSFCHSVPSSRRESLATWLQSAHTRPIAYKENSA
jgi:hypothetical protein